MIRHYNKPVLEYTANKRIEVWNTKQYIDNWWETWKDHMPSAEALHKHYMDQCVIALQELYLSTTSDSFRIRLLYGEKVVVPNKTWAMIGNIIK